MAGKEELGMAIEELLQTSYWVVDILPALVPKDGPGQYFAIEKYFLSGKRLEAIKEKHINLVLKLNCYRKISIYGEEDNPAPELLAAEMRQRYLYIMVDEAMILSEPDDTHLTIFNPDAGLLDLVREIAAGEGLYVWKPPFDVKSVDRVSLIAFSPTGSSMKVGRLIAGKMAELLSPKEAESAAGAAQAEPGSVAQPVRAEPGDAPGLRTETEPQTEEFTVVDLCGQNTEASYGPETVCVFAVPCYGGRVPRTAAERLRGVRGNSSPAVVCVTYGNRAYEDALLELADLVEKNGFRVIAGCAIVTEHNIMHVYGKGRPDKQDREQILQFATDTALEIRSGTLVLSHPLPGNRPYKEWGGSSLPIEVDETLCTDCGLCAKMCPVGAIEAQGWKTDENLCINCMRCVKDCPAECRYVPKERLREMTERLRAACAARKKNSFFG